MNPANSRRGVSACATTEDGVACQQRTRQGFSVPPLSRSARRAVAEEDDRSDWRRSVSGVEKGDL